MARTAAMLVFLAVVATAAPAHADAVVTKCTGDREGGGTNLADAIQAGGVVTFSCGDSATIQMSASHTIDKPVVIDGGLKVTLKDGGNTMFSLTAAGASLELRNLKFQDTKSRIVTGDVNAASAPVRVAGSTFDGCDAPLSYSGPLTILDSVFTNTTGGAVNSLDAVTIERSRFQGTKGIAVRSFGPDVTTRIVDSVFVDNSDGALLVGTGSSGNAGNRVELVRDEFSDNGKAPSDTGNHVGAVGLICSTQATNCSVDISGGKFSGNSTDQGGALQLFGATAVTMRDARFDGNSATGEGGAVFFDPKSARDTKFELRFSVFKNNRAQMGGAVRILTSNLIAQTVTFSKNTATGFGGAISATDTTAQITRGVFADNVADRGGAIHLVTEGTSVIANTLMVRNRSNGAFSGVNAAFINVTIADNVGIGIHTRDRGISLRNSIVSGNSGGNCLLDPPLAGDSKTVDAGNNIEFPTQSCAPKSILSDPRLDTLFIPVPGSAALGNGDLATCMNPPISARDVYGKRRPQGVSCTIGAVEGDLEKEVADQTVGGPKWPGGLDQGAGGNGALGDGSGQGAGKRCCCCRRR